MKKKNNKKKVSKPHLVKPSKIEGHVQPDQEVQKAPKTPIKRKGPPKNIQSIPTQDVRIEDQKKYLKKNKKK